MALMTSANHARSSGKYPHFKTGTFLLSRPMRICRCDLCALYVRTIIENSIVDPAEPLMIPTFNVGFGWWNVRLPSEKFELPAPLYSDGIYIDEDTMHYLEKKKVINWCSAVRRFHPIRTTGDGNCLMHAVILATCGMQDAGMVLRRLVYIALVDASANTFRERWQKERERLNERIPGGVQLSSEEWDKEWNIIVSAAEDLHQNPGSTIFSASYAFLEEMHVFVLANVLQRPIIILGEPTVRSPLAGDSIEHNNFVGIYLPLLWNPLLCDRHPIMLCFLMNHFQPLVTRYHLPSEPKARFAVPLVSAQLEPLHIHFLLAKEDARAHNLLQQYLYTSEVAQVSSDGKNEDVILVAEFSLSDTYLDWEFQDYFYLTSLYASPSDDDLKITEQPASTAVKNILPSCHKSEDMALKEKEKTLACHKDDKDTENDGSGLTRQTSESSTADNPISNCVTNDVPLIDSSAPALQPQTVDVKTCSKKDCENICIPENSVLCSKCIKCSNDGMLMQESQNLSLDLNEKNLAEPLSTGKKDQRTASDRDLKPPVPSVKYVKQKYFRKTPVYWREPTLIAKRCVLSGCEKFVAPKSTPYCVEHSGSISSTDKVLDISDGSKNSTPHRCKSCGQTCDKNSSEPSSKKSKGCYKRIFISPCKCVNDYFWASCHVDKLLEIAPSESNQLLLNPATTTHSNTEANKKMPKTEQSCASSSRNIRSGTTFDENRKNKKEHLPNNPSISLSQKKDPAIDHSDVTAAEKCKMESSVLNEHTERSSKRKNIMNLNSYLQKLASDQCDDNAEVKTLETKQSHMDVEEINNDFQMKSGIKSEYLSSNSFERKVQSPLESCEADLSLSESELSNPSNEVTPSKNHSATDEPLQQRLEKHESDKTTEKESTTASDDLCSSDESKEKANDDKVLYTEDDLRTYLLLCQQLYEETFSLTKSGVRSAMEGNGDDCLTENCRRAVDWPDLGLCHICYRQQIKAFTKIEQLPECIAQRSSHPSDLVKCPRCLCDENGDSDSSESGCKCSKSQERIAGEIADASEQQNTSDDCGEVKKQISDDHSEEI